MSASYELKSTANDKFSFTLKAGNGEVILSSQTYASKASAQAGIESVRTNGGSADNFETKTSSSDQPYFVLKAANGQIIGQSEMYSAAAAAQNGIASVQKNCSTEVVKDLTV